jgi:CheY-like chemotaxis protein
MSKKILIIEDDPDAALLLKVTMEEIKNQQIQVEHENDGIQALNYINTQVRNRENIDLILLDCYLPGKTGIEIAHTLWENKKTKDIPIVMITVLPLSDIKKEQEQLKNIKTHFRKPANLELVRKKVEEILGI